MADSDVASAENAPQSIAVVLKGYPRLSETFIAQELLELERAGFRLRLYSMRHPTDRKTHPIHDEITAPVVYLPEYLHHAPLRVLSGWLKARRLPGYREARRLWFADFRRDLTRNRFRRFGQALVLAAEIAPDAGWIYGHFIHTPGSVSRYTHVLTGLPWSVSAHAKDIWTSPAWELREKLASARWAVTCTCVGHEHLSGLAAAPERVHLVYHGIDLGRFPVQEHAHSTRDGRDPGDPVRILTVGRAVAKKGLDTLVGALATLPSDLAWHWTHIGGGELSDALRADVERLGLTARVSLMGSRPQDVVLEHYRASDLFVLPSRIAADGDRDGLPNVLVEAASQGLACISTPISGIVELIRDGENGLLVEPDDPAPLSEAMAFLIRNPVERGRLGRNGAERVHAEFGHDRTIGTLVGLFEESGVPRRASLPDKATKAA